MSAFNHRALLHKNPDLFKDHAFLHHEIAERLVTYLQENPNFAPKSVLEMGKEDQQLMTVFQEAYPNTSYEELREGDDKPNVDLIISNLYLQNSANIETTIQTMKNHLNPNGKIFLSTIAEGSFENCMMVDGPEFNEYPSIKRLGDYLHSQGFVDVIMHLEKITLQYNDLKALLKDIRVAGGRIQSPLMKGLRTKNWYQSWVNHMHQQAVDNGIYEITIEILYGHAQMPPLHAAPLNEKNEAFFDLKKLRTQNL